VVDDVGLGAARLAPERDVNPAEVEQRVERALRWPASITSTFPRSRRASVSRSMYTAVPDGPRAAKLVSTRTLITPF